MAHALRYEGTLIPLVGQITVGRSPQSDLVIESERVSRRHARFSLGPDGPHVEDLGSSNGVFVNSSPIAGRCKLKAGDRIAIGDRLIEVVEVGDLPVRSDEDRQTLVEAVQEDEDDWDGGGSAGQKTLRGDSMGLLGGVVERMLDARDVDGAERLMMVRMRAVLSELQGGAVPSPEVLRGFTSLVLRLAATTRKSSWVDFLLEAYTALGHVVPLDAAKKIYDLAPDIGPPAGATLASYLARMEGEPVSASDRFALQRLEAVATLARRR